MGEKGRGGGISARGRTEAEATGSEQRTTGEAERHKKKITEAQLRTIHPNPGHSKRGRRNQEREKIRRKEKKRARRVKLRRRKGEERLQAQLAKRGTRAGKKLEKIPKIITWNLQKMAMRENNRRKLRQLVTFCLAKEWEVVLLTEITSVEEGFF